MIPENVDNCFLVRITLGATTPTIVPVGVEGYNKPDYVAFTLANLLSEKIDKHRPALGVYETGDADEPNPHIHIMAWWNIKAQSLRNVITGLVGSGNKYYSVKQAVRDKLDDHITYLCKGSGPDYTTQGPHLVLRCPAFDDAFIEERHALYWRVRKEREQARAQPKRKREESAGEQILALCASKVAHGTALSRQEIGKICIHWFMKNRKTFNEFHVKSVFNWVALVHFDQQCGNVEQSWQFRAMMDKLGLDL